jgi:putative ABC transport system permease protein
VRQIRAFLVRLRAMLWSGQRERELAEELEAELQTHLQLQIEDKLSRGMDPAEARRAALIESGGLEQAKEAYRDRSCVHWLEVLFRDLRYAVRSLLGSPVFAMTAIVSIALGIGANAAIFTLLHATLWKPLPVPRPAELYHAVRSDGAEQVWTYSWPLYEELRGATAQYGAMFARGGLGSKQLSIAGAEPERVIGETVTGDYFSALEIQPSAGRLIDRDDDRLSRAVLVLSHAFWQRRFHADPAVIGKIVQYQELPYQVVGIAQAGFAGIDAGIATDVWVPTKVVDSEMVADGISSNWLSIMLRTRDAKPAQAVIEGRFRRHVDEEELPRATAQRWRESLKSQHIRLRPAASGLASQGRVYERALQVLMAIVGVVLLISCANVANLLLARNATRRQELAVRIALGAGYGRLASQLLSESLVLAVTGSAAGLGLGMAGCRLLMQLLPPTRVRLDFDLRPDATVIMVTVGAAIATALLCGIGPVWQAWRSGREGLRDVRNGGRRITDRTMGRRLLVAGQLALSLVLISGAGLFLKALYGLATTNLGFRPEHVMAFEISFPRAASKAHRAEVSSEMFQRLSTQPGFSATYTSPGIYENGGWSRTLKMVDGEQLPGGVDQDVQMLAVGPEFFDVLGIRIVEGRFLDAGDNSVSSPVVVVNQTFAQKYFPGASALGHFVQGVTRKPAPSQIVGVVRDVKHMGVKARVWPALYLPALQRDGLEGTLLVRAGIGPAELSGVVRSELKQVDPSAQIAYSSTLEAAVNSMISRERLIAYLSAAFGALAVLLAAVGLYGVMAYSMSRRTGEIGIRMALGAQPRDIRWLALRESLRLIALGVVAGVFLALAAGRLARGVLYGVSATDPWALASATLAMISVALTAGWLPAARAARTDPNVALRQD